MKGASCLAVALALVSAGAACSSPANPASATNGDMLFHSKKLSSSTIDIFTCATCHDTAASDPAVIRPGAPLPGVTGRTSFWGGMEGDLLAAVNDCRRYFMSDRQALANADPAAESLYAYLETLEPGSTAPVPFTVVSLIVDVARGDAAHGATVYTQMCGGACHGEIHTGTGRLSGAIPILPDDVLASHATYTVATQRLVFIEKTRHGGFYGYTGVMPPFSTEVLSDGDLGDLLEALGVTGVAPDASP